MSLKRWISSTRTKLEKIAALLNRGGSGGERVSAADKLFGIARALVGRLPPSFRNAASKVQRTGPRNLMRMLVCAQMPEKKTVEY